MAESVVIRAPRQLERRAGLRAMAERGNDVHAGGTRITKDSVTTVTL